MKIQFTLIALLFVAVTFGQKDEKNSKKEKTYEDIITEKAESKSGLFTVHLVDDKYYYEIPDSLLGTEMLMVTRIAKTANGLGFGGGKQNTQVVRWVKNKNQILLRMVSYENVASDSLPIHEAVENSNFEPIIAAFPIEVKGKEEANPTSVIDITKLFTEDVNSLGISNGY